MMAWPTIIRWHQARPRLALGMHAVIAAAILTAALIAQYGFGMEPCDLCIKQRIPYFVIIGVSILAVWLAKKWAPWALTAIAVVYAVGGSIAFFHVGVEQHWWSFGCGFQSTAGDIKALYEQLASAPVTPCDKVAWRLFGLSMAVWNVVVSAALFIVAVLQIGWTGPQSPSTQKSG